MGAALFLTLASPGSTVATPQVLNVSHDLVSLGIASQNLTANNPALDATPLFQAALNYVQSHSIQTLTLDKGTYYLLTNTQGNAVLMIQNTSNVVIDLAGSTFYFNGPELPNGIQLFNCSNVTLTNFHLDYLHPPYTHVMLTSVDAVHHILSYQTLNGWPNPSTFNGLEQPWGGPIEGYWGIVFRNGDIVPGTSRMFLQTPFTNNTLVIQDGAPWAQSATLSTLHPGDTIGVLARGGGPALVVVESTGMTISNIDIYGSGEVGVRLYEVRNSIVDRVRVMPRPGAGLIGSAGGIEFLPSGPNNHIRNCYISRALDDALTMLNVGLATVTGQPGVRQLTVSRNQAFRFANGSLVNFLSLSTTLESDGGVIVDQSPPDSFSLGLTVTLTFDRDLPPVPNGTLMVFGSADLRGQGSTIEDNVVEDIYGGRGVWLAGVEGTTVRRNVLRRTSNAGIIVQSSTESVYDPGDAGPPSHSVTITDNVLQTSLGPEAAGTGLQGALGAIQVVIAGDPSFAFTSAPTNTDVTIANNYIADSQRSGIWIGELSGGTLSNNLITRYSQNPSLNGTFGIPQQNAAQVVQDALLPVAIHHSTAVTETGDSISAMSAVTAPVTLTPSSATLQGPATNGSFNLVTAVNGFAWQAASDSSWLTVQSSPLGSGNGSVQYAVAPNRTGKSRTGNLTIAGELFQVTQASLKIVPGQVTSQ